jgi:hypothetical protein
MENPLARQSTARPGSFTMLAAVVLLSAAVAFFSQAAAPDYPVLLRTVLLVLCLPQLVLLCALGAYAPRKVSISGFGTVLISWLFVAELGIRAFAA